MPSLIFHYIGVGLAGLEEWRKLVERIFGDNSTNCLNWNEVMNSKFTRKLNCLYRQKAAIGLFVVSLLVASGVQADNTGLRSLGTLEFRGDGVFINLADWPGIDYPNAVDPVDRLWLSSEHAEFESLHSVLLTASVTGRRVSLVFLNGTAGCVQVGVNHLVNALAIRFES